ncbi:MAG TPA: beta-galactosidase [Candidatus Dormibacteraeota bacterium]|nr:beta-galactosidase [Candidatus Dormibacteraeota bacterium]
MHSDDVPRPEYPRPQFRRGDWECLNGWWQFEADPGDSGEPRGMVERELRGRIRVPFCPESELSGIGDTDFCDAVWYRRAVTPPDTWVGRRLLLHFQAVDYDATVWVDGQEVARHRGGFTPFTCDLGVIDAPGQTRTVVVRARDDHRPPQPRGKQSQRYENYGCLYVRTTGIWQTVWMEPVPETRLHRPRLTPDVAAGTIRLDQGLAGPRAGLRLVATLSDGDGEVSRAEIPCDRDLTPHLELPIPTGRRRLWGPGDPHLYQVRIELLDEAGRAVDQIDSYAGLRSVTIDGQAVLINGERVFQRLVLDQGYYPDGIMTAPSDEALRRDIELSMRAGFNGARLHQKVFEERFLTHADELGYLVWGEFGDWGTQNYGADDDHVHIPISQVAQWLEAVERDYSHPSIVGWCPLNETNQVRTGRFTDLDDATLALFLAAKAADGTRPVLDSSGYAHRVAESDIYDCHDYEQDPDRFAANQAGLAEGRPFQNQARMGAMSIAYGGQPFFVSEFGGARWSPQGGAEAWGYGDGPRTVEEWLDRFRRLCGTLLDDPRMFGYCYTQLTDVFQEQNGIYGFDRSGKFESKRLREAQVRTAAIERPD